MTFKISKIFLKALYVILGLTILFLFFVLFIFIPRIEKNTIILEKNISKIQLQKTAQIIQISADEFLTYKKMALQTKKNELKRLTGIAYDIINSKFMSSTHKTTSQAQTEAVKLLREIQYANHDYFFVTNYQSVSISHPDFKNKDFSSIKDIYGNLVVPPMVDIARTKGKGFTRYWWKKNTTDDTPYEKLSFVKNFLPWKWVVGTGVYIDDITKEIDKRKDIMLSNLKEILNSTKIGKSGYVYIFDIDGKMIIHPNKKLEGTNFIKLINPTKNNTYIFNDLIDAYKYGDKKLYYLWDKPGDRENFSYEKISWIEYNPYFKWYIVSTGYVDEFYESSDNLKIFIIYSALFISILIMSIGFFFLRQTLTPIVKLSGYAKEVIGGNLNVRYTDQIQDDEIGLLALQFNQMLSTIDSQIKNLDYKVEEKTKELSLALGEKNVLLKELQHRVKNNLNVINSIVGLQNFQSKQPSIKSFVKTIQQRINSMSLAHELLSKSKNSYSVDVKKYIETLVDSLIEAYTNPPSCTCEYNIDNIKLDIDKLLSCGLIINELVTNSIKYAFDGSDNYLFVSLNLLKNDMLTLCVKDNGPGFESLNTEGIGLELVKTLINQLNGSIEFNTKKGSTITINFKI